MTERRGASHGTPWKEAVQEVPPAWLEAEAKRSPSPHTLLSAWRGDRGVPAHVMLKLLQRRLGESPADLTRSPFLAPPLQRAHDRLNELWARTGGRGERHPIWRLVVDFLRIASGRATQGWTGREREARRIHQGPSGDKTQCDS